MAEVVVGVCFVDLIAVIGIVVSDIDVVEMAVEEAKIIFVDNLVPDEINVVGLVELILFKVFVCKEVKIDLIVA